MNAVLRGIDGDVKEIKITLSDRNLETFVAMKEKQFPRFLNRQLSDGTLLSVIIETDEAHYGSDDRMAQTGGEMGWGPDDVPDLREG